MGRECSQCHEWCSRHSFSQNQWRKGDGYSRCSDCVNTCYECPICYKTFSNSNQLKMHSQVHRPKNVACPVCGDVRFSSGANAVAHVESGFCRGCRGQSNARQQIYEYASQQSAMRPYISNVPRLTYGGDYDDDEVPDFPYQCRECSKSFRNLSQLMQHRDSKHTYSNNMLMY